MAERDRPSWTFLSNHGHVLMCLAADPDARLRDIAERVGVTERTVRRDWTKARAWLRRELGAGSLQPTRQD